MASGNLVAGFELCSRHRPGGDCLYTCFRRGLHSLTSTSLTPTCSVASRPTNTVLLSFTGATAGGAAAAPPLEPMLLSKGGAQGSSNASSLQQQFLAQQEEGIMPLLLRELTAHRTGQSAAYFILQHA